MSQVIKRSEMIRYCLADIAKGLFNGMIANYLLYFFQPTDKSGLPLLLPQYKLFGFITIMALLTALGKIIDAVSDPIVAYLSDRSPNKNGRRMPFMKKAAIPYALSVLLIFFAPFKNGSVFNAVWVGFFLLSYYVSYTFYFIPRNALVPEIIPDSKKRVTYYGISTAFFMGSSSFMYAATLFVDLLKKGGLTPLVSWRIIFSIFVLIGVVCLLVSAFAFKEKDYVKSNVKPKDSVFKSFKLALKNKNFVIFSLGDLFSNISMSFFQASMLFYITVLLNVAEAKSFLVMLTAIAVALCLFPLIIKLGKKFGKKIMLLISGVMFTIVYCFIFFGDKIVALVPGKELLIGLLMGVFVAFPFASINILPQSVLSDIIQEDSIVNHVNREGTFSAVKTFTEKIAGSIAMMFVSSILAIGASSGEVVGLLGVKLTGVFAGTFSIISLIFIFLYNEKKVNKTIKDYQQGVSLSE